MATQTGITLANRMPADNGAAVAGGLSVYDRMTDPLAAIDSLGSALFKAGVGGCLNKEQGQVLALACMCERKNPFEITRQFHIIDGKLSKKAEAMLADFNAAGGKHRWIKDGDDGIGAELELARPDGEVMVSTFSLQDAKDAGYVRAGGRWTKGPKAIGEMCRARCVSRGMRMFMPQISGGSYTPEELWDERDIKATVTATGVSVIRSAADAEARRLELLATKDAVASPAEPVVVAAIPGHVAKPDSVAKSEPNPKDEVLFDIPAIIAPASPEHRLEVVTIEIMAIIRNRMGLTEDEFDEQMREQNPGLNFGGVGNMSLNAAEKLLKFLDAKYPGGGAASAS